jgi:hypothetical protein
MTSPSVLREIRNTPSLRPYWKDVLSFLTYLRTTANISLVAHGEYRPTEASDPQDVDVAFPYIHRWTTPYRRGILAKFYQLEEWHNINPTPITMLTLTTYQEGAYSRSVTGKDLSIPESFGLLKNSWVNLRHAIKYYLPETPWCWIMEPHKSGYPHLHTILFSDINEAIQTSIKDLWAKKYKAGSYEHGIDFEASQPGQTIQSIRNYLMKYVAKGFTTTGSKFNNTESWSAGELVFNALVRKFNWRLFGSTRDLCKVMAYAQEPNDKVKWYATEILNDEGEKNLVWQLREPTGWGSHTRAYRELPEPVLSTKKLSNFHDHSA